MFKVLLYIDLIEILLCRFVFKCPFIYLFIYIRVNVAKQLVSSCLVMINQLHIM